MSNEKAKKVTFKARKGGSKTVKNPNDSQIEETAQDGSNQSRSDSR